MSARILAIDQGTTGTSATVYGALLKPLAHADHEFTQHFPKPGWVEHDADAIWATTQRGGRGAVKKARTKPGAPDGRGSSKQRETAAGGEGRERAGAEGKVAGPPLVRPTRKAIGAALPRFTGALSQVPPAYSAIKVAGERAYDLARDGQEVVLEARIVEVLERAK